MIKRIILVIIIIGLTILGLLQFPHLFIKKQLEYKSFKLYSKNPIELNNELKSVFDSVIINLKRSSFYQEDQVFELYFVKGTTYESIVKSFGVEHLASAQYNKHLYFGDPDFSQSKIIKGLDKYQWANLVQLISHESVHSQMYTDYSVLGFMKTPSWINEGYCEHISYFPLKNNPEYNLLDLYNRYKNSEGNWIETEFGSMTPKLYLRDRIIMEYLIDYKKRTILEIIENETLYPDEILKEMEKELK